MKRKPWRIVFLLLVLIGIAVIMAYRYVFSPVQDYAAKPADSVFTDEVLVQKVQQNTASLNHLKDHVVGIRGNVKSITVADSTLTIEIGADSSMSGIVCKIDERHVQDFSAVKTGQHIELQGRLAEITKEEILGLGNMYKISLIYCSKLHASR